MAQIGRQPHVSRFLGASLALVLLGSLIPIASVSALSTGVTPAMGGGAISSDTNSGTGSGLYTPLTGPAVTGTGAGDIIPGTVVLTLPGNFEFNPAVGTAGVSGAGCNGLAASVVSYTVSNTKATTTLSNGPSSGVCAVTFAGLQVRPTTGALNSGNITNTGTSGLAGATNYGTLTEVPGAPFTVTFTSAPGNSTGGALLAPQPKAHVVDKAGNPIPGTSVALTKTPGTGAAAGVLTCTTNPLVTNGSGDAQFAGCKIDVVGTGYKLRATSGSVFADSPAFDVTVGAADHLVFSSYPAASTPALLTPQPVVQVVDAGGNLITGASNSVTLTINQNAGTFACTTNPKSATSGTAAFTGCSETMAANGYTLTATTTGLSNNSVTGPLFNIASGPANKLAICWGPALICNTTPPSPIVGGAVFTTQPEIRVQDAAGNIVVTDNSTVVALGILAGTPTSGGPGTLTCTANSGAVTNGVFTLTGCKIDKAGVGYKLNAAATGLIAGQSNAFNVFVGPPVKLAFTVQPPASATAQAPFPGNIQVGIVDAGGNVVTTGITATINLAIATNPGAGTLTCTGGNNATTVNGIATFTGCTLNNQGNGYTLIATAVATAPVTVLASATSTAINVLAPAAAITLSGPAVITWGARMTLNVQFGINGGGKAFTIQVSRDALTWSNIAAASLTTNASGAASFVYGPSDNRYYRVSFLGTPDLQAGTSNIVRTVVRQTNQLRPTHSGYEAIAHGTQILFKSTVRPNRPELPQPVVNFVVYQLTGGTWTKVLDRMIATDRNPASADYGKGVLFITFNTAGQFYVRSQAVPTTLNANSGWSAPVRYTVQ